MAAVTKTAKFSTFSVPTTVCSLPSSDLQVPRTICAFDDSTNSTIAADDVENNSSSHIDDDKTAIKLADIHLKKLYEKYPTSDMSYISLQERRLIPTKKPQTIKNNNNSPPQQIQIPTQIDTMYDQIKLSSDIEYLNQATSRGSLVYGEINDVYSMVKLFDFLKSHDAYPLAKQTNGEKIVFYDLGSGTGRVVMAVSLLGYANYCIGIEIQSSLYQTSQLVLQEYNSWTNKNENVIEFHHGSILDPQYIHPAGWQEADILFINCTCFDNDLMDALHQIICHMASGSIVVTLSIMLSPSAECEFLGEFRQEMSWGMADYMIHQKR